MPFECCHGDVAIVMFLCHGDRLEKTDLAMSCWHYKKALEEDPAHKEARERLAVVREMYRKEVCLPTQGTPTHNQPGSSNFLFPPTFTTTHMPGVMVMSCGGISCCTLQLPRLRLWQNARNERKRR